MGSFRIPVVNVSIFMEAMTKLLTVTMEQIWLLKKNNSATSMNPKTIRAWS